MNLKDQLDTLLDATAFDSTGAKVGAVRQVYVDDASGKITFATVATGIFSADAIVPLHGARLLEDELHLDHTRAVIRDSPRPDNTEDALTPEQEVTLLEHYGIESPTRLRGTVTRGDAARGGSERGSPTAPPPARAPGDTTSGSDTTTGSDTETTTSPATSPAPSDIPDPEKSATPGTATSTGRQTDGKPSQDADTARG